MASTRNHNVYGHLFKTLKTLHDRLAFIQAQLARHWDSTLSLQEQDLNKRLNDACIAEEIF